MYVFDKEENIMKNGEKGLYQHFHPFPQCFQKPFWVDFAVKGLTLSQTTNFILFQTERGCRRQFQV